MMKTPEEIKKGLRRCEDKSQCDWCSLIRECEEDEAALAYIEQLEASVEFYSNTTQMLDAKIEKLESHLTQVERERDAAVRELEIEEDCYNCKYNYACKHDGNGYRKCSECGECPCSKCNSGQSQYEWRGICPENTKEE